MIILEVGYRSSDFLHREPRHIQNLKLEEQSECSAQCLECLLCAVPFYFQLIQTVLPVKVVAAIKIKLKKTVDPLNGGQL
jgi:hypothetical protein